MADALGQEVVSLAAREIRPNQLRSAPFMLKVLVLIVFALRTLVLRLLQMGKLRESNRVPLVVRHVLNRAS